MEHPPRQKPLMRNKLISGFVCNIRQITGLEKTSLFSLLHQYVQYF